MPTVPEAERSDRHLEARTVLAPASLSAHTGFERSLLELAGTAASKPAFRNAVIRAMFPPGVSSISLSIEGSSSPNSLTDVRQRTGCRVLSGYNDESGVARRLPHLKVPSTARAGTTSTQC